MGAPSWPGVFEGPRRLGEGGGPCSPRLAFLREARAGGWAGLQGRLRTPARSCSRDSRSPPALERVPSECLLPARRVEQTVQSRETPPA